MKNEMYVLADYNNKAVLVNSNEIKNVEKCWGGIVITFYDRRHSFPISYEGFMSVIK
jgi:hypothetical protein